MRRDGFEIEISQVNLRGKIFFFLTLLVVLLVNVYIIYGQKGNKTYALSNYVGVLESNTSISVFSNNGKIIASKEAPNDSEVLATYECKSNSCVIYDFNVETNQLAIVDNELIIYDYINNTNNVLDINASNVSNVKFIKNNIYIVKDSKYALYDLNNNSFITDFIYDGINNRQYTNLTDSIFSLFTNNSKYNQTIDIFNNDFNVIKHYEHCSGFNDTDTGYCSEHIEGSKTNQEIDEVLDKVTNQYPNLSSIRLFTIKTAIETFGLPYTANGGHSSLDNMINISTTSWNTSGLDNSGFVRWVYYISSGVDTFKEGVDLIRSKNPNLVKINEEELLPGDLIMSQDHVVIYLYKDKDGNNISVHASFTDLKVEINNYKEGNQYYRLGIWS